MFSSLYPAVYSISIAFIGCWLFSVTDKSATVSQEKEDFDAQFVRSMTGIGAEGGSSH